MCNMPKCNDKILIENQKKRIYKIEEIYAIYRMVVWEWIS